MAQCPWDIVILPGKWLSWENEITKMAQWDNWNGTVSVSHSSFWHSEITEMAQCQWDIVILPGKMALFWLNVSETYSLDRNNGSLGKVRSLKWLSDQWDIVLLPGIMALLTQWDHWNGSVSVRHSFWHSKITEMAQCQWAIALLAQWDHRNGSVSVKNSSLAGNNGSLGIPNPRIPWLREVLMFSISAKSRKNLKLHGCRAPDWVVIEKGF